MKLEFFIAKRLYFTDKGKERVSIPAVRVAIAGIAVGLAVMILTIAIVLGFKKEVSEKAIGFGAHIQVMNFDSNNTYEMQPIIVDSSLVEKIKGFEGVRHVQCYATKPCILKTQEDFEGVVLKGIGTDFDWDFFARNLVKGQLPTINDSTISKEILISEITAKALKLDVGDAVFAYFVQDDIRARKFQICGIYNTDFSEYDKLIILGDNRQVQQLNQWRKDQYSGIEILIDDFKHLDAIGDQVYFATANRFDEEGNSYYTRTIKESNPQLFSWLRLLDMNVWVIIVLMLAVAGFNMISGLLILILEKINFIGTMKALGSNNKSIRKIFMWQATFLITKGMIIGNLIGLVLCALQYYFHIIPLDASAYYVSYVPIYLHWTYWLLLNIGTWCISVLMLIGPSHIVTKISPAKVMRYE